MHRNTRLTRPRRSPNRTRPAIEREAVRLCQRKGLGPARIAGMVNLPVSTVHRMLVRHGLNRLDHLDRVARGSCISRPRDRLRAGVLTPPSWDPNEEPSNGISEKSYLDGGKNPQAH